MSVLFIDSFDDRETAQLNEKAVGNYGDGDIVEGGLCGTQGFRDPSIGDGLRYGWHSDSLTVQVGLAFFNNGTGAKELVAIGNRSEGVQWFFRVPGSSTDVQFWTGPNTVLGTLRHTAVGAAPLDTWVWIEMRVFLDAVSGTIDCAINGSSVFSASGIDTTEFWSPTDAHGTAKIHCTGGTCVIDNFYVMDGVGSAPTNASQFIGPWHVIAMQPFADGDARGWQASGAGSNASHVDEVPVDYDTTYVRATSEGPTDLYDFLDVILPVDTLYAVQQSMTAKKTYISNAEIAHVHKVGSGTIKQLERWGAPAENWYTMTDITDRKPDGNPWTISDLNRSEFGMRHFTSRSASGGFPA